MMQRELLAGQALQFAISKACAQSCTLVPFSLDWTRVNICFPASPKAPVVFRFISAASAFLHSEQKVWISVFLSTRSHWQDCLENQGKCNARCREADEDLVLLCSLSTTCKRNSPCHQLFPPVSSP